MLPLAQAMQTRMSKITAISKNYVDVVAHIKDFIDNRNNISDDEDIDELTENKISKCYDEISKSSLL